MDLRRGTVVDGFRLTLPPRRVPPALAWGLLAFGLAGSVFMVFWIGGAAGWQLSSRTTGGFDAVRLLFAALGLPGLAITLGMLVIGLGLLRGWSFVQFAISRDALTVRERIGWLGWTWRIAIADLRGIAHATHGGFNALLLRRAGRSDLATAPGYPLDLLQSLAAALQRELAPIALQPIPVVADAGLGPPPGTLVVEEEDGRVAIALAAPSRPWALLVFALLWLGGTGFMTAKAAVDPRASWPILLFLLPFWAIGLGMVLGFIHTGGRRISLLWSDQRLTLIDHSPLRRRIRGWDREEIADILVVERGSGSGRYEAVAVKPRIGKEFELPGQLDASARVWIAARLRAVLTDAK